MHGGTVTAETPGEGKGPVFTVNLPLEPTSRPSGGNSVRPPTSRMNEKPATAGRLDGLKVLVIDDDECIRDALITSLSFQWNDCQVLAAGDGTTGVRL